MEESHDFVEVSEDKINHSIDVVVSIYLRSLSVIKYHMGEVLLMHDTLWILQCDKYIHDSSISTRWLWCLHLAWFCRYTCMLGKGSAISSIHHFRRSNVVCFDHKSSIKKLAILNAFTVTYNPSFSQERLGVHTNSRDGMHNGKQSVAISNSFGFWNCSVIK